MNHTGTVKMINYEKGYGFIRRLNEADLFFHVTECASKDDFLALDVGSAVSFDIGVGRKGDEAREISLHK